MNDGMNFPPVFMPTVSMVPSAAKTTTKDAAPGAIITAIRDGKYSRQINAIRKLYSQTLRETGNDHQGAKKAVNHLKVLLPAVMWSGQFSSREKPAESKLVKYSGLLCADLDHLEEGRQREILAQAQNDKHVFAAFRSPTGTGVKIVFRVSDDPSRHRQSYEAVKEYVQRTYGAEIDEACKDIGRICFVSHCEAAFWHTTTEPLPERCVTIVTTESQARETVSAPNESGRREIAEKLLGPITWESANAGLCQCPGHHLHTTGNGKRDCMVWVNDVPTVKCFHSTCSGIIDGINHELRSRIGKAEWTPTTTTVNALAKADNLEELSEYDHANRLAAALPPIRTCGSAWHVYDGGAWSEIERATLRPQAQNILPEAIRTARRESTLLDHLEGRFQVAANSFSGFYKVATNGDILINARNGVVRISRAPKITFEAHSPDHLFIHRLEANYDEEATCPTFDRVLREALPDDDDQLLYQYCAGNFLLPDCRYETALVCYGEAGRCKSTLAEPISEVFGSKVVPRLTMSQICDPKSYHLPKLKHAAVNLGTELDAIELGDSATFKAIVSGEPVEARPIYGTPFTMTTSCKLWFLANCLPRFKHGTEAELRRTRFLRFDYLPPVKDVTLKAKLTQERDGVFQWVLQGLQGLLLLPSIPVGGRHSREVHDRFKVSNDPVGAFVANRCHLDADVSVSKESLRNAYRDFCEEYELPTGAGDWFLRVLYERWTQIAQVRARDGEKRCQMIKGICLKGI